MLLCFSLETLKKETNYINKLNDSKGEKDDARACVEMSLKMQEKMIELREKWKNEGFFSPFEIRIGINTGYCNVGNFGSSQRLTYTIIGGEVNEKCKI